MKKKEKKPMTKERIVLIVLLTVIALVIIFATGPLIFFIQNLSNGNDGSYMNVPADYTKEAQNGGQIVALDYIANGYNKTAYIYLPYGYNDNTKYNIVYFMHGAGESATSLIKGEGQKSETKNIVDNMIAKGDIEPVIIVFPTFYNGNEKDSKNLNLVMEYDDELINVLIPTVENKYSTYAENTDLDGIKESREHRAFGGYSMGSMTTWHIFSTCLDYFKWYMPLSGDLIDSENGLQDAPENKAAFLNSVVDESGYGTDDFFLYCFVGGFDSAYPRLVSQFREMIKEESFIYGDDISEGNIFISIKAMQIHDMKSAAPGALYNALPTLFLND